MTEYPALPPFVGLLCDIGRGAYLRREVFIEMLRLCGREGITHVLPYLEDMIRLPSQERACPACAYDATDWQDFERAASASGVELVPHVNVVGHTERILPHYPELLSTAGEHEIVRADGDGASGERQRLQAARAEAVDGHGCRLLRQATEERRDARDVQPLLTLGHRAAEYDVLDLADLGFRVARQEPADDLTREIVRSLLCE